MGGADGVVFPDTAPPSFVSNMVTGVVRTIVDLGLNGIDFDIERCVLRLVPVCRPLHFKFDVMVFKLCGLCLTMLIVMPACQCQCATGSE